MKEAVKWVFFFQFPTQVISLYNPMGNSFSETDLFIGNFEHRGRHLISEGKSSPQTNSEREGELWCFFCGPFCFTALCNKRSGQKTKF